MQPDSFTSVKQLVAEITAYLVERHAQPKPDCCKPEAKGILVEIQRARQALDQQRARLTAEGQTNLPGDPFTDHCRPEMAPSNGTGGRVQLC